MLTAFLITQADRVLRFRVDRAIGILDMKEIGPVSLESLPNRHLNPVHHGVGEARCT